MIRTLELETRREWRDWLREHHAAESEIWLVFPKRHTGLPAMSYDDAVEEALCFGWVDSLVKRLDEDRFARKFTPRKPDSRWSTINRRRYESLRARGLLEPAGIERAPTDRSGDAPSPRDWELLPYIENRLREDPRVWEFFQRLPPSERRAYVGWIDSAKKRETKERRLAEAVSLLSAGKKLGLK